MDPVGVERPRGPHPPRIPLLEMQPRQDPVRRPMQRTAQVSLLIRYSPDEKCLRSVGDAPNGVVGISDPDGVTFTVSGSFEPLGAQHDVAVTIGGMREGCEPLPLDAVVDGCATDDEKGLLWQMACDYAQGSAALTAACPYHPEPLERAVEFLFDLSEALNG